MASAQVQAGDRYQGIDRNGVGFKLLLSQGWSEGEGLGAKAQGIQKHIAVSKRLDATGIGADRKDKSAAFDYTANHAAFDAVLAKLNKRTGNAPAPSCAPAPSPSQDETRQPEAKRPRHVGRYKRRETQKDVKGYSHEDLSAILCGVMPGTSGTGVAQSTKLNDAAATTTENQKPCFQPRTFELTPLPKDWWGFRQGFVREGDNSGAGPGRVPEEEQKDNAERGSKWHGGAFTEADQERLAEATAAHARGRGAGRGGLGRGNNESGTGELKAREFVGKRMRFDDEVADGGDADDVGGVNAKEKWRHAALEILTSSKKGHTSGKGVRLDWLESRLLKATPSAASGEKLAKKMRKSKSFDVMDGADGVVRVRIGEKKR